MILLKKHSRRLVSAAFCFLGFYTSYAQDTSIVFQSESINPMQNRAHKISLGNAYLPESLDRLWMLAWDIKNPSHSFGSNIQEENDPIFITAFPLWNNYNKTMLSLAVHNKTAREKRFEYVLAPMVCFNPIGFAFYGNVSGTIPLANAYAESVSYKAGYTRFAYNFDSKARNYNKIHTHIALNFGTEDKSQEIQKTLYVRNIFNILESTDLYRSAFGRNTLSYAVNEIGFVLRDNRQKHPYRLHVYVEYIQELDKFTKPNVSAGKATKISAEYKQKITYFSPKKGLDIRVFAGTFLGLSKTVLDYRYRMSSYGGFWDYKFDDYYLGRNESSGALASQLYEHDGGFKVLTPLGQTNRWLLATNLKASLPGPIPVKPFFDMAVYRQIVTIANTGQEMKSVKFNVSGGIMVSVINDVFEIYFPIFHSKEIKEYLAYNQQKWYNQIRFQLNVLELNPKRIREKIEWLPR